MKIVLSISQAVALAAASLALVACSSTNRRDGVTVSKTVEISVATTPEGARCLLERSGKEIAAIEATPQTVTIDRAIRPITVTCELDRHITSVELVSSYFAAGPAPYRTYYSPNLASTVGIGLGLMLEAAIVASSPANYEYPSSVSLAMQSNVFPDAESRDAKYAELREEVATRHASRLDAALKNCNNSPELCRLAQKEAETERDAELARLDNFREKATIEPPQPPPAEPAKRPGKSPAKKAS